ncbi:RNA-directed DNA polymerase (Reverse transcriptase), Ribonuclease H [Gossypium australe]|uniref:RNA-directed DNA polymerase (Reverse transcriptase), Ribonuclease H n=1 Tax=Gossypium australe TaxID=47621 RepID=A0A5B6WF46_9ROSI|nr:RNA-directed DNA polymerase (Reverse transcriptase), Ribonuclease H [Gossypium australe]
MNGTVEAANKNIKKIVGKMTETYKDWHEKLPFSIYTYRTSLDEEEWIQSRYDQLNLIEEKRLKAIRHGQMYQKRMMRAYNRKVRPRKFHEGDLVLKKIILIQKDFRGKWMPNWEGPYVVKKAFLGGTLILTEMDGKTLPNLVNSDSVKKYFT